MKQTSLILLLVLVSLITRVCAQPTVTTTSFTVAGIKVIFKPTQKRVINIRMYYRGGVTNYPAGQAGIENLTLSATTQCGTKKYQANAFRDTAGKYGILLSGKSTYDYGYIQLNCISKYFDKGWDLFTEAVNNPVFDGDETTLLKNRMITAIKSMQSSPQLMADAFQMKSAFANTPYENDPIGNEQTVGGFSGADLQLYYKSLLNKNRLFMVVVGNIDKQELYEKILLAFNEIPNAPYTPVDLKQPVWSDNKLATQEMALKTNYVNAMMPAPEFTNADYVPFRLAISGLGGNLYASLRSARNLSYDPTAGTEPLRIPYAYMSASSTSPKEVIMQMINTLRAIQASGYQEEWLQHIKNVYITNNYINDQSAAQITNNLGLAEVLGNWQYADDLPQLVNFVTLDQVNRAITYYITGIKWTYLGNPEAIEGFTPPPY